MKKELFYDEIDRIQMRNALFFPAVQKEFIQLSNPDEKPQLIFADGYDLPDVITMEIELAFKLVFKPY